MHKPDSFSTITICALVRVCFAALVFSWAGSGHAEMLIQGIQNGTAPASNYDRFDNSPQWIGNPSNWTGGAPTMAYSNPWMGVGRDVTSNRWGTLISPSFIVSASHYAPNVGDTVQFFATNSLTGATETRTVVASESLAGITPGDQGDVWIGKLSAPITDLPTYPILKLPTAGVSDPYGNLGISTFGLGALDGGATAANSMRLGRNTIWAGSANSYTAGSGTAYAYYFTYDNPGVGPDESQVIVGDSGAPSFFQYAGGTPALLGLHWFNNDPMDTVSADTWLSNYTGDIQKGMNQLGNPNYEKVKTISPLLGDFNLDGRQTTADLTSMSAALGNLSGYESSHGMNDYYLKLLGDFNGDGVINATDLGILSNVVGGTGVKVLGDANGDGFVNILDFQVITNHWLQSGIGLPGDLNGDGIVNLSDLYVVMQNYGKTNLAGSGSLNSVPEPSAWLLVVIGVATLLVCHRVRNP